MRDLIILDRPNDNAFDPVAMFQMNRQWWVTLNVSIGVFMSTLDASVVNISLPTMTQALNTHVKAVAWVVMSYLIVITGCLLLMGRLADLLGQKRVYLFGLFTFTLGSALCGFSPTVHFLIGSRMIQGFGASALMAIGPAIITAAFPERDRGQALGIIGSVVSAGFLTGPILGGFLVEHLGWRSVFFINLPIGVMAILMSSKFLERKKRIEEVRLDLLGAFLLFCFVAFFLLFLNGVSSGPRLLPIAWFSLALVCFIMFIFSELRSPAPLVDLNVFRRRLFVSSLGTGLLSFWMSGAHTFVAPFFLQNILGFSPSKVGILIFPLSLTVMFLAPLGGRVSDRVGARIPATIGLTVISLTLFSFTFLKSHVSDHQIIWRHVVIGIGIALFNPANNSAIIGSLPKEKIGFASSFLALSRNLGMMIGIAFAEMVIALRIPAATPSLESIHDVWKLGLLIGLIAILISWVREKGMEPSGRSQP